MICCSPDDLHRIPGLYRRWELAEVLQPLNSYRIEEAGADADGTPLLAIYSASPETLAPFPRIRFGTDTNEVPQSDGSSHSRPRPSSEPGDSRVLGQKELARRWNLSERTLERWRSRNTGPAYTKIGSKVRYPVESIHQFERQGHVETCRPGARAPGGMA